MAQDGTPGVEVGCQRTKCPSLYREEEEVLGGGAMHPWAMLLVAQDLSVSAASQAAGQLREPHLPQGLLEGSPQEWQFCACPLGVFRDLGLSQQGLLT